jgi:hypothetical protein
MIHVQIPGNSNSNAVKRLPSTSVLPSVSNHSKFTVFDFVQVVQLPLLQQQQMEEHAPTYPIGRSME